MPRFSVVIPTLRRADTLSSTPWRRSWRRRRPTFRSSFRTTATIRATRELVERTADQRVHHFSPRMKTLPMAENWERTLATPTATSITFVGDDDGLLPDARQHRRRSCSTTPIPRSSPGSRSCTSGPSYWTEPVKHGCRRRVSADFSVAAVASAPLLQRFFAFQAHYSKLPMIYNSFVSRSLLERVRERHGRYFIGSLPDRVVGGRERSLLQDVPEVGTAVVGRGPVGSQHRASAVARRDLGLSRTTSSRDFPISPRTTSSGPANLQESRSEQRWRC